jgi:serine/threonine protein kinase
MPRSLFITDVEKDPKAVVVGGFGNVFKGKHDGQLVALKMLYKGRRAGVRGFFSSFANANLFAKDSIEKGFYTEALAWRSLSHRFILPLLGIYEEGSQLFLVSPFMTNGALCDWRKEHSPVRLDEIQRLVRRQPRSV